MKRDACHILACTTLVASCAVMLACTGYLEQNERERATASTNNQLNKDDRDWRFFYPLQLGQARGRSFFNPWRENSGPNAFWLNGQMIYRFHPHEIHSALPSKRPASEGSTNIEYYRHWATASRTDQRWPDRDRWFELGPHARSEILSVSPDGRDLEHWAEGGATVWAINYEFPAAPPGAIDTAPWMARPGILDSCSKAWFASALARQQFGGRTPQETFRNFARRRDYKRPLKFRLPAGVGQSASSNFVCRFAFAGYRQDWDSIIDGTSGRRNESGAYRVDVHRLSGGSVHRLRNDYFIRQGGVFRRFWNETYEVVPKYGQLDTPTATFVKYRCWGGLWWGHAWCNDDEDRNVGHSDYISGVGSVGDLDGRIVDCHPDRDRHLCPLR